MTTAAAQDEANARRFSDFSDEILDYRAALAHIRDLSTPLDVSTLGRLALAERIDRIHRAALNQLNKVRR